MTYTSAADLERCINEAKSVLPFIEAQTPENWPKQLHFLVENYSFATRACENDAAFQFDEGRQEICFNDKTLASIRESALVHADDISTDWSPRDRERVAEAAVNLFVIHELTHVVQNFPHYHLVPELKAGLGVEALALLDVTADFHAAWVAAHIEWRIAGCPSEISTADYFTNMLMLAHVIGAKSFPPLGRGHKVQRFIGILLGAILNQADQHGLLDRKQLNPDWSPRVPLLAFDFSKTGSLNAFMTQPQMGLLLRNSATIPTHLVADIWNGVGTLPTQKIAEKLAFCLAKSGILRSEVVDTRRSTPAVG